MTAPRSKHAAVLLQDGNVLIAGGTYNTSRSSATAEIYNTTTRTFTSVGSMKYRRADFTLTLLPSGKVLATGGIDWLIPTYPTTCELYDPVTRTWSDTRVLRTGRRSPVTVLLADSVLTMGGCTDEYNYLTSCEKYYLWSTSEKGEMNMNITQQVFSFCCCHITVTFQYQYFVFEVCVHKLLVFRTESNEINNNFASRRIRCSFVALEYSR